MKSVLHRLHDELDDRHWWFVARRRILLRVLEDVLGSPGAAGRPRLLDIGCGAGATLRELARFGEAVGVDPAPTAVEAARRRSGCAVHLGGLPDALPFGPESFDVVLLLDVLEHVDDDLGSLQAIRTLLRPGGSLLCTVPAFPFLWSEHDLANEHRRRYTRPILRARLERAGLRIRKLTYYNSLLFLPIAAVRLLRGRPERAPAPGDTAGPLEPRPDLRPVVTPLNALLASVFAAERHWLRVGSFPFGLSLLAVARRPEVGA